MEYQVQFRGSVPDGETRTWFTWGWPAGDMEIWAVLPVAAIPSARISLQQVDVEHDGETNTYYLTVTNDGSGNVIFDAVYVTIPGPGL